MADRGLTPKGLHQAAETTSQLKNPYGKPANERFHWLKDKSHIDRKSKIAVFVGCTPSYVRRSAAQDAIEVLDKLGVDYTIASGEWCCAHPLMSAGERDKAKEFMQHNIETYRNLGVEQILFICPGCQATFTNELPELLGEAVPFKLIHLVELIAEEINSGRASITGMPSNPTITYHDPCTMGRQLGIFEAPRQIIKSIPGIRFMEMPRHGKDSFCCGSGSFVRLDFPELTNAAGTERFNEAANTGADILVTSCTSCLTVFQQVRAQNKDSMEVMDMVGFVKRNLQVKEKISG